MKILKIVPDPCDVGPENEMGKLNAIEYKKAVESLKEICQEIGCSGLDPDICQNRPHHCDIIRKLCHPDTLIIENICHICGKPEGHEGYCSRGNK